MRLSITIITLISILLSSCSLSKKIDSELPKIFLEDVDLTAKIENFPFDHSWIKEGFSKAQFKTLQIKPIRIDLLPKDQWANSASLVISSEEDYFEHANQIAIYFHQKIIEALKNQTANQSILQLTETPNAETLIIEIALTELEFGHPIARSATLIAPVPGTSAVVSSISDPHAAFAARISEGGTGRLVASVADRKFSPNRIIDLNKLSASSSLHEICSLWSESIAEAINGDRFTLIKENNFSLLPF